MTNPAVNSFKRLNASNTTSGATWSPNAVTWAGNNRTTLVRVPSGPARMEVRSADMAANPYLLPAALIAAGLDGLRGNVPPAPAPTDINMFKAATDPAAAAARAAAPQLPQNLSAALDLLDGSEAARAALGDPFVDAFVKLRRQHWDEYCAALSQWELDQYLDA